MNRIIMDTSNLTTIMASAKPTGRQANSQAAVTLLEAFNKVRGESQRYTEIKMALNTFYAARGLNLPCRLLDSFFTGEARNKARNYLTSLEVIALLGRLNERNIEIIKPLIHRYMQEKGMLERTDARLNAEMVLDCWHNDPPQHSPYLTGHILSSLCNLSDKPGDMINTWDIGEFSIFGDKACTEDDVVHLPVQGGITFIDDDLPFAQYPFKFFFSSLGNHSFCKEFLASEKIGDSCQPGSETVVNINITKQSLSNLIEKIALYYAELQEQAKEHKKIEDEIAQLLIHDNGNNNIQQKVDDLRASNNYAFNKSLTLKSMYTTCRENANLFASYHVQIVNDLNNNCAIIPLGTRGLVKLVYNDIDEAPDLYDSSCWTDETLLYTWLEKAADGFVKYNNAISQLQESMLYKCEEYRQEQRKCSDMLISYYTGILSAFQQEEQLHKSRGEIATSGMKVEAVSDYIGRCVDTYKNIMDSVASSELLNETRDHVFKMQQELTKARLEILYTEVPIPGDNYSEINSYMDECIKNINAIKERTLQNGIVSEECLNELAKITDSKQLAKMIEVAANDYLAHSAR